MRGKFFSCFLILLFAIDNSYSQWNLIGPYNILNTENAIKTIPCDGKICMAKNSGVYISLNKGNYWINASNGLPPSTRVSTIAFDGKNIIIGTHGTNGFVETQILLSTNYGTSYKQINNIAMPRDSRIMALSVHNDTILASVNSYNSDYDGVYYSINNGKNWKKITAFQGYAFDIARNDSFVFAATQQGIYKSANNGLNWEYCNLKSYFYSIVANGNDIYAANGSNTEGDLYQSPDNGRTWKLLTNTTCMIYPNSLAVDKYKNIYMIRSGYLMKSTDNAKTWNYCYFPMRNPQSVAVDDDYVYVDNTSTGVGISPDNGKTWLTGYQYYTLKDYSLTYFNNNLLAGTYYGLYKPKDNSWVDAYKDIYGWAIAADDSIILVGNSGKILLYSKSKSNWIKSDLPIDSTIIPPVSCIAFKGNIGYAGTNGAGIFCSRNGFTKWHRINSGLYDNTINSLLIKDNAVFAATNRMGVYMCNLDEESWIQLTMWPFDTCIHTLASNTKYIFAGTKNNGVFRSDDLGKNWIQVNNGLTSLNILSLYTYGENIFAGTYEQGLFMSNDNGKNWVNFSSDLINKNVNAIIIADSSIYSGTDGGIWIRPLSDFPVNFSINRLEIGKHVLEKGEPTTIFISACGGSPPYKYSWNTGDTNQLITIKPIETSTYNISITDKELNKIDTSISITVNPAFSIYSYNNEEIKIYPNPVIKDLIIESKYNQKNKLTIYNSFGLIMKTQEIYGTKNQINVDFLQNGIYILCITNNEKTSSFKFIKY